MQIARTYLWDRIFPLRLNLGDHQTREMASGWMSSAVKNHQEWRTRSVGSLLGNPSFPFSQCAARGPPPARFGPGEITAALTNPKRTARTFYAKMEFQTAADLTEPLRRKPLAFAGVFVYSKAAPPEIFSAPPAWGIPNLYWGMDGGAEWSGAPVGRIQPRWPALRPAPSSGLE